MNKPARFSLAALSAALLSLAFPIYNLWFFAYISFVPLFYALKGLGQRGAVLISYASGFIFFAITISWLRYVSVPGYLILTAVLAVFFGIFGIFFLSAIRYPLSAIFLLPAFWVILEYIRSILFTGFGWSLLGHCQYLNLPIIQISDITGAYGISFIVMMVNAAVFLVLSAGFKKNIITCLAAAFIIFSVLAYGYFKLNEVDKSERILKVAVVQGDIPQSLKWDPEHKEEIFDVYADLTREAASKKPDLIIWPETALPGFMEDKYLSAKTEFLAKDTDVPLLIGAPSYKDFGEGNIFNSAFLISKNGKIIARYDKLHLVPFGEYIPFRKRLGVLRSFIDKPIGDFTAGNKYKVFNLDAQTKFSVLICFEDIFPGLVRRFISNGAAFIINITNDAWFMRSAAPYQHAQSSVFRAVENRRFIVRAANTGLSCFIDTKGRISGAVSVSGEDIFVKGYSLSDVIISKKRTAYNKYGDVFVLFCLVFLVIKGGVEWLKKRSG